MGFSFTVFLFYFSLIKIKLIYFFFYLFSRYFFTVFITEQYNARLKTAFDQMSDTFPMSGKKENSYALISFRATNSLQSKSHLRSLVSNHAPHSLFFSHIILYLSMSQSTCMRNFIVLVLLIAIQSNLGEQYYSNNNEEISKHPH